MMGINEIFQAIIGLILAFVFIVYGNKMLNSMVPPEPEEKKH